MALGNILRDARESRKLTPSQVASATHMKVQTVQAIEEEDFSQMPAAIYCKGFIRLYAEYMGLDATPLTREYVERFVEPPPPEPEPEPEALRPKEEPPSFSLGFSKKEETTQESEEEEATDENDLFSYGASRNEEPPDALFDHTVHAKQPEDIAPPSLSEGISELSSRLKSSISQLTKTLREKAKQILPAQPAKASDLPEPPVAEEPSTVDTSPITIPNRQILIISGIIAAVVLLIFLISVVVGQRSSGDKPVLPDSSPQELILPVEPPPPYID